MSAEPALIVALVVIMAALLVAGTLARIRAAGGDETARFAQIHGIDRTAVGLELCRRYLSRARQWRFVCSFAGLVIGLVVTGRVGIYLVAFLPGWFAGVIGTELFRLRANARSIPQRTASLERRSASRYVAPRLAWHGRAVAAATVALTLATFFMPWVTGGGHAVGWAAASLVVLLVAEVTQHAIAARTRPALPAALEEADEGIRRVGARAVGFAASGLLAVLLGLACISDRGNGSAPAHLSGALSVAGLLAIVWATSLGIVEHREFWPPASARRLGGDS